MKGKNVNRRNLKLGFGNIMSRKSGLLVLILFGILMLLFLSAAALRSCCCFSGFSKFVADMVYDGAFKEYLYAENAGHNGFWSIVATVLGELLLSGLILATIIGFIRSCGERYENGRYRKYRWKNHVLFLGYDDKMMGTLKACKNNRVIIAVPNNVKELRDVVNRNLAGFDMMYLEFVQCRRDDLGDLRKRACVSEASQIYIIGQPDEQNHDALNFKSLAIISNECANQKKAPHIITYLQNQASISMLKKTGLNVESLNNMIPDACFDQVFLDRNCEFFNFYTDTAFNLLTDENKIKLDWHNENKNLVKCNDKQVHLVVIGMTEMGVAIVREALKLAHPSGVGTRFKITMVDENAYTEMHYFIGRTRELFELCNYEYHDYDNKDKDFTHVPQNDFLDVEFEFIQCDAANPKLIDNLSRWATDGKQLLTLVVCTKQSSQNMAVALYLPVKLRVGEDAIPVWDYQEGDDSMKHLLDDNYKNIHPFSVGDHAIFTVLRSTQDANEKYERAKHLALAYDAAYTGKEADWENMLPNDRWSSVYSGFSMDIKLRAVGDDITSTDPDKVEKAKEAIDKIEHNRWNVEKLSDGYIPTTMKQHDEVERELDEQLQKYPNWRKDKESLEKNRIKFNNLKKGKDEDNIGIIIHDNIRSFEELDDYTKGKDRLLLDDYIKQISKN